MELIPETAITTHVIIKIENSSTNMQIRKIIPLRIQQNVFETVAIENCVSKEVTECF